MKYQDIEITCYFFIRSNIQTNAKHLKRTKPLNVTLYILEWSSNKERRVDALALRAEEGRDKLRKAAVRSKYPTTRRYPNGETRPGKPRSSYSEYIAV